jgi:hypothetical protein
MEEHGRRPLPGRNANTMWCSYQPAEEWWWARRVRARCGCRPHGEQSGSPGSPLRRSKQRIHSPTELTRQCVQAEAVRARGTRTRWRANGRQVSYERGVPRVNYEPGSCQGTARARSRSRPVCPMAIDKCKLQTCQLLLLLASATRPRD